MIDLDDLEAKARRFLGVAWRQRVGGEEVPGPAVVLELIDRLRKAELERDALREDLRNDEGWKAAKAAGQLAGQYEQELEGALEEVGRLTAALLQSDAPTSLYSDLAITVARAEGRLRVEPDGRGWIRGIVPDRIDAALGETDGE